MANENETIEHIADEIKNIVSKYGVKAFGPIIYAYTRGKLEDRIIAAHKRELASVMGDLDKLLKNGDLLCVQKVKLEREIEKRNALIKEIADALDGYPCHNCKYGSGRCEWCDRMKEFDSLIAKARDVISKTKTTTEGGK